MPAVWIRQLEWSSSSESILQNFNLARNETWPNRYAFHQSMITSVYTGIISHLVLLKIVLRYTNCCCVFLFFISVFFFVSETHLYALLRTYTGKIRYINCHQMIKTTPEVLKRKTRYTRFMWYFNLDNFFSSNDHEFVCFREFVGGGLLRCSRFAYVHHRNGAR